jgi:hypothetical protein
MALWQFDLFLAPRDRVVPLVRQRGHASGPSSDSGALWASRKLPDGFERRLETILPWSLASRAEWKMFGEEDGTRVDLFMNQHGAPEEIRLRLDARSVDPALLQRLAEFTDAEDCVFVLLSGQVVEPNPTSVWVELELSPAMQFIHDPIAFLSRLQQRRDME